MTDEEKKQEAKINKDDFENYLKVWKHYEDIAMHFNELIIRLRTESIGGLAALAAILGIFLHSQEGSQSFKCGLAIVATVCLMCLWIAVWILDMCYYNRLLEGAVNAILELEKNKSAFSDKQIKLSSDIEASFSRRFPHEPIGCWKRFLCSGRNQFYLMVFIALSIILVISAYGYYRCQKDITNCSSGKNDIQNVLTKNDVNDMNEKI